MSVAIKLGALSSVANAKHAIPRLACCFDTDLHSEDSPAVYATGVRSMRMQQHCIALFCLLAYANAIWVLPLSSVHPAVNTKSESGCAALHNLVGLSWCDHLV